ncbi:BTB/POZ/Kelch-associated protein [Klebsormidium nitens]|uniref:BTB/POZ/Kelch-associated protein n=1 Tax=Klebsormidium nitens TaxID=105231 RepID=A0A1Y1HW75_KLENI|nr:BTB/POZ/Kelch-associated protein [Klebsormidium nitens]|eukprot:GAQ80777.1 BTB/POZ/Kelch-associated protein [Klebsormidium nitens]
MADEQEQPPGLASGHDVMDEEGHFFDFIAFYKKVEFSDRAIRLEILEESRRDLAAGNEPSTSAATDARPSSGAEEIPVNSIVIAAKSAVLRQMLSNGMRESDKGAPVVLKVTTEEKEAFKEMLHFLYAGTLSPRLSQPATTVRELLNCLVVGDKFEVPSFMGALVKCLSERKRTIAESAELVGALTGHLGQAPKLKALADEARAHIVSTFCDVSGTWASPEFYEVGTDVIEILLQSEELEADCEEEICRKVLKWAIRRFQTVEERTGALATLLPLIRFKCMTGDYLVRLLSVPELQSGASKELIDEAIEFQAYTDDMKRMVGGAAACERRGVQAVHLEIVDFFDFSDNHLESRYAFWFDKNWHLHVTKGRDQDPPTVQIFLICEQLPVAESEGGPVLRPDDVEFRIYVRTWPEGWWKLLHSDRATYKVNSGAPHGYGKGDAFGLPWDDVRDSPKYSDHTGHVTIKVVARRYRNK